MVSHVAIKVIAVGGNSELLRPGPWSLRQLSDGPNGGKLGKMLAASFKNKGVESIDVDCSYYSWAGEPREDSWLIPIPPFSLSGAARIQQAEASHKRGQAFIVVGWSNGADTAFNYARRAGAETPVDVLITLDPVSRLSSLHWLPFNGTFDKPVGVKRWLHAYPTSWGASRARAETETSAGSLLTLKEWAFRFHNGAYKASQGLNWGNAIAAAGGAWDSQPRADENIVIAGNHGDTIPMLTRLLASDSYSKFAGEMAKG